MNRLFYILFLLLLSLRVSAMINTEAIQYVNRYYDLLNQYAVVKNDAPGLARQITSMHVENAGSIYPDIEVKLGGLPDTKGVVISTYLTSISDPERKRSMLLKFVPRDIIIKSNSGGVTCVSYTLYVYDDNATPNTSVLKYSIPLEMRINQYYKIKSITKSNSVQTTTLSVSPTSLSFGASGGTRTITVSSNKDWSISVGTVSWGHLTRSANILTLKVDANNTGESRSDYFKIKAGDKEQKVTINQGNIENNNEPSAKIHRIWTEDDIYEGGVRGMKIHLHMNVYNLKSKQCCAVAYFYNDSGTALVDTNNKYDTKDGKVACWVDFTPGYDNTLYEDFSIFIPYDELHTSSGSYKFNVVLWNQSVSPGKEITRQDGINFTYNAPQVTTLSVSPTSLSFGASGGTRTITVSSNKDWSISVGTVSWGHLTRSGNTLTLKVDANNTGESRSDYFKIIAGDKEQKVTITQGNIEKNNAPSAKINRVWTEEDVYEDGIRGLRIHLNMNAYNLKSKQCRATAYFQTSSGTALIDTNNKYHTNNGKVSCGRNFTPGYDNSLYEDFAIFMPYDELHTSTNGSYQFDIVLWNKSVSPSKEITRHDGVKFVYNAPQITTLSVSPTSLSFGAAGGSRTITVSSNKDWSISVGTASWGHLTRGGNTLTLRVDANTGSERSDFFKIKAGDKEQKISISQEASTNVNIENVWVDHNVPYTGYRNWWNGFYWQQVPYNYNVMRIHVKFSVNGRKGERLRVCAFFFHEDGKKLKGTGEFSTPDGQATVQVVATPTYENSQYDDFILNIPYETMKPKGKRKMKFYIQIQDQSGNSIATSSYEYFTLN